MRKLVAGATFACLLSALPCWAQEATTDESSANSARRAEQAAGEAQYWANEAARAAQQDPRAVMRRRAAFKRANRIERLEARKWAHRSSSRPMNVFTTLGRPMQLAYGHGHGSPWHAGYRHGGGVWGGSLLGHGSGGYAESSRAPVLGLFGGLRLSAYPTSR